MDNSIPFLSNQQVTLDATDKRMLHSDHYVTDESSIDINDDQLKGMLIYIN